MVDNYHSSLDVAKTPIQSDADAQKSEAETEGPSSKSSQIAAGESIADSVRNFLELRQGGIPDDTGVVFDKISAVGSGTGSQDAPTVTSAAQSAFGLLSPLQNRQRKQYSRPILSGFSGTINPGEMLLVLGKPGSGCTTFLKTLSGLWDEYKEIQGELTLGGHPLLDVMKQRPQDILFCEMSPLAESDDHFPTLTVAETLRFATRARCGPQVSAREIDTMVTQLAKLVGLGNVLNTKVGDAKIRGVSGGERRRVSLAEALATCARLICLDNPTHGLDSSTAVEFMEMMREWTTQSRCVAAMSVYQASDAIVSYFDKVLVINSGRQIYYGPVRDAKAYFEDLGFECLSTTTVADFLNVMSADPDVRRAQENRENQVPRTAEEFERAFSASPIYQEMQKSVQVAKERFQTNPSPLVKTSAFALPIWHQIWYCAGRQFRIVTSDYSLWAVELATIVVQSLVLGTLFRNQQRTTSSLFIFASALFYSVLVPALQSMAEFGNGFAQRPLILKQKRYQISRPIAYALGLVTTDVRTAGNFFTWFLIIYLEHLALSMFFRSVAIFSPNMHRAVLPVGIFFNMYVLYTGLYVPAPQMQVWLGWLRYLNPLYYAFESVMVNEFRDLSYQCSASDLVPSGLGYNDIAHQVCAVVGSEPGDRLLSGASYIHAQYGFKTSHLWRNVGINAALFVFFALCSGIGMEMLKTPAGQLATVFYKSSPGVTHRRDKIDSETGQDQGNERTRCHEAIQYFQPRSRPCGPEENPAEYFLAVIGAGSRNDAHMDWASLWNDSEQGKEREKEEQSLVPAAEQAPQLEQQSLYSVPFHVQLWVVVQRTWLYYWREPDYVNSKLWMSVGNSLLNSLTYLQSPNTERGAYNRVFSAFMSLIVGPPLGLQVQPRFVTLRDIFVHRERESLTYHWLAFVLSAFIVELPFTFLSSLVYWLLWYFPVGYFNAPSRAGYSFLMYELFGVFATSLAQLCASLMPNIEAAFAANGFFFMFCNTFAGTLSPKPVTPSGWRWFYNISPLFYLGEGVTVDVLQDLPIRCEESEVSIFYAVNGTTCGQYAQDFLKTATGYLLNPASTTECQYCRYRDGQSYFQQYGYEFAHRHRNIGVFICFIAFNFTMVLVMTYLTKTRRH
ncbi:CDR ABC transporter [Penicillium expansum]|nr:CDR ABC transporter [Penicillium expansum]